MEPDHPRRLVPELPFPPYSYVTGRNPHPTRDSAGHSYGVPLMPCPTPDPNLWRDCRPYLFGLDLFNHGYYWEAHEVWENVWHSCGRMGPAADFIKGLIKLAAAGVKAREGRPEGVRRHARRAAELFTQVAGDLPAGGRTYFGVPIQRLGSIATEVGEGRHLVSSARAESPVEIVFDFVLAPDERSPGQL